MAARDAGRLTSLQTLYFITHRARLPRSTWEVCYGGANLCRGAQRADAKQRSHGTALPDLSALTRENLEGAEPHGAARPLGAHRPQVENLDHRAWKGVGFKAWDFGSPMAGRSTPPRSTSFTAAPHSQSGCPGAHACRRSSSMAANPSRRCPTSRRSRTDLKVLGPDLSALLTPWMLGRLQGVGLHHRRLAARLHRDRPVRVRPQVRRRPHGVPDLSALHELLTLNLNGCKPLTALPDLSALTSLQTLNLETAESLTALPDLSALKDLKVGWTCLTTWRGRRTASRRTIHLKPPTAGRSTPPRSTCQTTAAPHSRSGCRGARACRQSAANPSRRYTSRRVAEALPPSLQPRRYPTCRRSSRYSATSIAAHPHGAARPLGAHLVAEAHGQRRCPTCRPSPA